MAYNGSGVFVFTSTTVTPATANTLIESNEFNTFTADVKSGLDTAICSDGQTTITANLPMATYKHTGVGASSTRTDYTRVAELQDGKHAYQATDSGAADAYAIALTPQITAYAAGQRFVFKPANDNTGASTIAVSGLVTKNIKLINGSDPAAGDIDATGLCDVIYDGTSFILQNPATLGAYGVTSTAAEINIVDGDTADSSVLLVDADQIIVNDAGVMKQTALTDLITYIQSSIPQLIMLDSPQTLVSSSTENVAWTQFDMSAAGSFASAAAGAGATVAILRCSTIFTCGSAAGYSEMLVQKNGLGGTALPPDTVVTASGATSGEISTDKNDILVKLDSNSDFEYYTSVVGTGGTATWAIYLIGYYA